MGFVAILLFGAAAFAVLARLGVARRLWSLVGAVLMLGAAGYAWQGRPLLPGAPREAGVRPIELDQGLIELRGDMFGRFYSDAAYLVAADALTRSGDPGAATNVILAGIRALPASPLLWTGLGDTYAIHDGGQVSPPALFAFRQAMRLSPRHPGPPFFLGLAYVRAGRFTEARRYWRRALALTPASAPYRPAIAVRLALLEGYLDQANQPPRR